MTIGARLYRVEQQVFDKKTPLVLLLFFIVIIKFVVSKHTLLKALQK